MAAVNTSTTPSSAALDEAPRGARPTAWRFDTRELVLAWCLWLIGVWALLLLRLGFEGPALRWMAMAAVIGLMGLWPAARLSQDQGDAGKLHGAKFSGGVVLLDWLCLNLVFQAVLWPMRMASGWSWAQALWLDAAVAAWSLLTGVLIAWGRCFGTAGMRTLAMIGCMALVVLEPLVVGLAAILRGPVTDAEGTVVGSGWDDLPNLRLSPVQAVWELTAEPAVFAAWPWSDYIVGVAVAAAVGWVVLAVLMPRRRGPLFSEPGA